MKTKAVQHLQIIRRNDEYGTPVGLFRDACQRYQIWPEIDACASHENHMAAEYYTKDMDMFTRSLNRDFFMNPPYSQISEFLKYARQRYEENNVNALLLVYAKVDTEWWHTYIEGKSEVHNIKGRIRFNCKHGYPKDNVAPYPNCWVIWRKRHLEAIKD